MGDVNYLLHVNRKIMVLEKELGTLEHYSNVLRNYLKYHECKSSESVMVLTYLIQLSDMKLSCIKQLQHFTTSRFNFLRDRN